MFNKQKFKASVIAAGLTMENISRQLNINTVTLYRKINGTSDFTRAEIQQLRMILNLNMSITAEIFFAQ